MAPAITSNTLEYNDTIEDVSNKSLVTNVLRGRDGAPLYLTDLAQIRGGLTASASTQASLPYGPTFGTVQAGPFSTSTTPSFDVNPGNTKKFYQGIMNPISKGLFEYYVEQYRASSNLRTLFYLLVSAIDETTDKNTITHFAGRPDFYSITDAWLVTPPRVIKNGEVASDASLIPTVSSIDAKALIDAANAGLEVKKDKRTGQISIRKKANEASTICFYMQGEYVPVDVEQNSTVKPPTGDEVGDLKTSAPSACSGLPRERSSVSHSRVRYKIHLRSVEQAFYYLGYISRADNDLHTQYESGSKKGGCRRLPFYLHRQPVPNTRFSVNYRGETFFVGNSQLIPCEYDPTHMQFDNTLQVLAILNELLNLNRDADEVSTTKAVQTVGPK